MSETGTPFFTVVIPTWNRAPLLREALPSVFAQRYSDFEVIVVDDGSTDDTAAVAGSYGDRIRYLHRENRGPGVARNLGISQARGRYLAFLDSDDLWFPWTLAVLHQAVESHDEPAIVAGTHIDFADGATPPAATESPVSARAYRDYIATAPDGIWFGTCGTAVRRDVLVEDVRFSRADINAEDHDLWLRLGTAPGFVHVQGPPLFAYRRHQGSRIGDLTKTVAGARHLVRQEQAGVYPGGATRQHARREILGRHLRPVVIACARAGRAGEAWELYRSTFAWNFNFGRARFLFGATALILMAAMRKRPSDPGPAR